MRNERWIHVQRTYPENVFGVAIQMRIIPEPFKRIASFLMPRTWAVYLNLCEAKRLVSPIVRERRKKEAENDPTYEKPDDFLQWLMDEAWSERDGQPDELVHRLLVLALASVHTTSMTAAQTLFDLIARPEYIEPLREEILQALAKDGGWKKTTLTKMVKLDSFMKESQRFNGPSLSTYAYFPCFEQRLTAYSRIQKGSHGANHSPRRCRVAKGHTYGVSRCSYCS
jgi:ent-kaurene oxidase